jgi:hypothetical protein
MYKKLDKKSDVKALFKKWIEEENAEGLVVRSELPIVYKIKPRYSIDAAVVGYSEGTGEDQGKIRALLLAMMTPDGCFQIIGKTGGGFSDEAKSDIFNKLQSLTAASDYIETDSNHTAFHMIKPEFIIELMVNDVIFETTTGVIHNALLDYQEGKYVYKANKRGLSMLSPIFVRFREDKKAVYDDIRLEQINEFSYIEPSAEGETIIELAKSRLIQREVYKKGSGAKLMVQKYMLWETNKENAGFTSYVFHYTNYSSDRKDPLQREVYVSNSLEQMHEIFNALRDEKVKKGWEAA